MITVSQVFKRELENDNRRFLGRLDIRLANGENLEVRDDQIMQGGFKIEDGISRNNNFDIGGVVINKLTVSINNMYEDFQDMIFEDAIVTPFVGLELGPPENRVEWVRKGVFTVDEPRHDGDIIKLECLDNMAQLDRPFTDVNITFPTRAWQLAQAICRDCGIPLATTAFNNPNQQVFKPPGIETLTCRQVMSYLCQISGSFARCDNMGRLAIRRIPNPLNSALDFTIRSIKTQQVHTEDIRITGIMVADNGDNDRNESRIVKVGQEGYVLDLGQNRLARPPQLDDIAGLIGGAIVGIQFRPMSIIGLADPSIEAGAVFEVIDSREGRNQAERRYRGVLTNTTFVLGGNQTFSCDAETPRRNSATRFSQNQQVISIVNSVVREVRDGFEQTRLAVDGAWEAAQEAQRRGDLAYESGRIAREAAAEARVAGENAYHLANQAQRDAGDATNRANDAFGNAMSAISNSDAAFARANSAFERGDEAFDHADSAFARANDSFNNALVALQNSSSAQQLAGEAFNRSIQSSTISYAVSTSGTAPPTTGWQSTVPPVGDDQFLWTRTQFVLMDGNTVLTAYSVSRQGGQGQQGAPGASVVSVRMQYYLSTSYTTQTGGSWSDTIPTWISGRFFWERVVTTLSDGTVLHSTPVLSAALNQALITAFEARNGNEALSSRFEQHATLINMAVERQGRAINDSVGASVSITWERGTLSTIGAPNPHTIHARSNFVSAMEGRGYLLQTFDGRQSATVNGLAHIQWFRANRTFISRQTATTGNTLRRAPAEARYARVLLNEFRELSEIDCYMIETEVAGGFINLNNVQSLVQINMTADSLRLQAERNMGDIASNRSDISRIQMNADNLLLQVQRNASVIGVPFVVQKWETGSFFNVDGSDNNISTAIRSANHIPVIPGDRYVVQMPDGSDAGGNAIAFFDNRGDFISVSQRAASDGFPITVPVNATSMRARVTGLTQAVASRPNEFRGNVFRMSARQDLTRTISAYSAILMQHDFINMRVANVADGLYEEMASFVMLHDALQLQVLSNTLGINNNKTDIASLQLAANTLRLQVESNTTGINTNRTDIAGLQATANSLRLQVESHATSINANTADIARIQMEADSLLLQVQSNTDNIGAPFVVQRWEMGSIDVNNGNDMNSTTAVRTPDFIPVTPGIRHIAQMPDGTTIGAHVFVFYDAQRGFASQVTRAATSTVSTPVPIGIAYMRVRVTGLTATVASRPGEFRGNVFKMSSRQDLTQARTVHSAILMQRDFINMRVVDGVNEEMASFVLLHNALRLQVERHETDIARIQMDANTLLLQVQGNTNNMGVPFVVQRWETGTLNITDGSATSSNTAIRSVDFIPITPDIRYIAQMPDGTSVGSHNFLFYNAQMVFVSQVSRTATATTSVIVPSNAAFMRVRITGLGSAIATRPHEFRGNVFRMSTRQDFTRSTTVFSSILMQKDFINLRVQNIDGVINQINISTEGILIAGNRVHITGQTTIDNAVIGTAHIRDLAVTTAKIANAAVTSAKIGTAQIDTAHIRELSITTGWIADLAVTRAKIGNAAVGSAQIGDAQILWAHIANAQILSAHIGNLQVLNAHIANATIQGAKIANATITDAQIHSLNADKITAGTITGRDIVGGTITQSPLGSGSHELRIARTTIAYRHIASGVVLSEIDLNTNVMELRAFDSQNGGISIRGRLLTSTNPTLGPTFRGATGNITVVERAGGFDVLRTLSFTNGIMTTSL